MIKRSQRRITKTSGSKAGPFITHLPLPEYALWEKLKGGRNLISFVLELTARCNNNCWHCYINLPADDKQAQKKELSLKEIEKIAQEAVSLGALWCLITGGEPMVRKDFFDIYVALKKKGLFVSVHTNASLISKRHIKLFKEYPPRDIEVTVYGVTPETYERVSRRRGSFRSFIRGLNLLLENGIGVRLKTMALRSNVHELPAIAAFCRQRTKGFFRFDPFLHLRCDHNPKRNEEIRSERLLSKEIVAIEQSDPERFHALEKNCDKFIIPKANHINCNHLFRCGAGNGSFVVSYDGLFRLCSSLWHADCLYDLKRGTLSEAWRSFIPKVRDMRSNREEFLKKCSKCPIFNLCLWCPAHSDLESGRLDEPVDYFCEIAHARAESLTKNKALPVSAS